MRHTVRYGGIISIHALREEGDSSPKPSRWKPSNFYPRPPRGGRRTAIGYRLKIIDISIHALREEGDPPTMAAGWSLIDFYPRPPRGGRLTILQSASACF